MLKGFSPCQIIGIFQLNSVISNDVLKSERRWSEPEDLSTNVKKSLIKYEIHKYVYNENRKFCVILQAVYSIPVILMKI